MHGFLSIALAVAGGMLLGHVANGDAVVLGVGIALVHAGGVLCGISIGRSRGGK